MSSVSRLNEKKQFRETAFLPSCSSANHDASDLHSFWPQGFAWQKCKE